MALSAATGLIVGAITMLMERVTSASAIVPFVATLVSTVIVGLWASWWDLGPVPLFAVCAPMAVLVPGALITNALLELTASDIVTGTARLVSGLVVLGFMATGILAAAHLTGLRIDPGSATLIGDVPRSGVAAGWSALPGSVVVWAGVLCLGAGVGMAFRAGAALTALTVAAMGITFGLLLLLTPPFGDLVATGMVGAIGFVAARLLERSGSGVPSAVSFQPVFLLLVPGTVGLVALTTLDSEALSRTPLTFVSLCVGTKVGSVIVDARWSRLLRPRSS